MAGRSPEAVLLDDKVLDSDQLSRAMAERYGLRHVDLNAYHVDMGAANMLSSGAARRYKAVPVGYLDKDTLLLAMADPANVIAIDDVADDHRPRVRGRGRRRGGHRCPCRCASTRSRLRSRRRSRRTRRRPRRRSRSCGSRPSDAPVIKLVYSILGQAVTEGASDIHFETGDGEMRVRFRVDGVLHEAAKVPKRMISGVVSRVKIMSDMDIAEKRVPQDGRVSAERREPQGRPANHDAADAARRGLHDPHSRQGPGPAHA